MVVTEPNRQEVLPVAIRRPLGVPRYCFDLCVGELR
jgi:hypothetical protein